jgi:hypothetical protein
MTGNPKGTNMDRYTIAQAALAIGFLMSLGGIIWLQAGGHDVGTILPSVTTGTMAAFIAMLVPAGTK